MKNNRLGPLPPPPPSGGALSSSRARLLEVLRSLPEPVRLDDLARRAGLHANTVREHLEALTADGLVERHRAPHEGRGRPAWLYAATAGPQAAPGNEYAELAAALAHVVERTSDAPAEDAAAAGVAWGGRLAATVGPPSSPTSAAARRRVVDVFDRMGFAPRPDRAARDVRLTRCPLLAAAQESPTVVCAVHLGIVHGALEAWGHDGTGSELRPFAEPGACVLRLAADRPGAVT